MKQAAYRAALDTACALLRNNLAAFTENFQSSNSEHNFYLPSENVEWTTYVFWDCFLRQTAQEVPPFLKKDTKRGWAVCAHPVLQISGWIINP